MTQPRSYSVQSRRPDARSIRRGARCLLQALCLLLAWLPAAATAEVTPDTEYRVKTAFLYNFARFITWPALPPDEFGICVLGSPELRRHTNTLLNKTVHQRTLRIRHLNTPAGIDACQLVFIGSAWKDRLQEILPALANHPVLTVSDIENFAGAGGMIGFLVQDNKIRFEINTGIAEQAGLSISSKLLTLATAVRARNR